MEKLLRARLTTVVVLAVVFGSGLLLGLALDRTVVAAPEHTAAPARRTQTGSRREPLYMQVGPDEAQKAAIDSIVQEYRKAMGALHEEFRAAYDPRYEALLQETRSAIKGVLTPEQAQAYDSLLAVWDSLSAQRDRQRSERGSREERDRS
jgi:Spy/CpxP family protein refolding chaperone